MEEPRDVRTSQRDGSGARQLPSPGSAVAMEIKRKKIRQSALFLPTEKTNMQERLDFEMRMREGAYKLLLACTKREQVLNASKNLMTCNARIKGYLTELHKVNEQQEGMGAHARNSDSGSVDRVPCRGTIAMSGLRIPLMWRDSDHFNNKGSSRRAAVFCLMQIGSEVFDTQMMVVDRSVTDICFEGTSIFKDADPQFELKVALWSCALEEELTVANTPKKLAKKLRSSFGKAAGKKLCPLLDSPDPDTFLQYNPIPSGAKYSLLAHTTLRLPEAEGSFQSHSLIVLQDAGWSSWLPLYGNLCCKLVAQPACMTQDVMAGYLSQKQTVEALCRCCRLYCVLSAGFLSCYFTPEEIDAKVQPTLTIPINQDTRIRVIEKQTAGQRSCRLSISNPSPGGSESVEFSADTRDDLEEWLEALHQHLYDQGQWLHCCERLMKIEVVSPRKPSLFLTKQADSVYNDLSITSPGKFESITDMIHDKIEETDGRFLIGGEEGGARADWAVMFDGSRPLAVQRGSDPPLTKTSTPCPSPSRPIAPQIHTPLGSSSKKRRAPAPPPDREPYHSPALARPVRPPPPPPTATTTTHCQEKENSSRPPATTRSKTGRPSLDAKFSAIIQQLQRNNAGGSSAAAAGRRHAPLGVLDLQPRGQAPLSLLHVGYQSDEAVDENGFARPAHGPGPVPVPTPRTRLRKSFRERMNLKAL